MALVLDRIFFYLFFIVCIVGTAGTRGSLSELLETFSDGDFELPNLKIPIQKSVFSSSIRVRTILDRFH